MELKTIAQRISYAIRSTGHNASTIAPLLGISRPAVSLWMSGNTKALKASNLFALADVTGYEAKWLFTGKGPVKSEGLIQTYQDSHTTTVLTCMDRLSYDEKAIVAKIATALTKARNPSK